MSEVEFIEKMIDSTGSIIPLLLLTPKKKGRGTILEKQHDLSLFSLVVRITTT